MGKKVSLKDIALHLGVSTALVSYVLNNKEKQARVGKEIAQKIRDAAIKLNYQPNQIAKSLKSGRTNTIGLIVADISNPFFSNIARIIEDEARKHGYVVIFGSSDESAEKSQDLINVFFNRQVDAFIISPAQHTEKQVQDLLDKGMPVVLIDRFFPEIKVDSVHINNFQAAYHAVEHLIKNGRDKIGMIAYDTDLPHIQERKNGYREALKKHHISFKRSWLKEATYSNIKEEVKAGIISLLHPRPKVDALLFATNSLAVESLKNINRLGIKVPDQLAIISFDESDAFDFFYSPVTYISQPMEEMGREAVELALARILDNTRKHAGVNLAARLVIRKSCGS